MFQQVSKYVKNDKKMNIDKTRDSINLEADVHKFGRQATPSDNNENETQETVKQMLKNSIERLDLIQLQFENV